MAPMLRESKQRVCASYKYPPATFHELLYPYTPTGDAQLPALTMLLRSSFSGFPSTQPFTRKTTNSFCEKTKSTSAGFISCVIAGDDASLGFVSYPGLSIARPVVCEAYVS